MFMRKATTAAASDASPAGPPRVGLVLGAGGVVGQAYHAGVLAALEHDYGWDPRTADVIVGTSAGSITGTLLRSGIPASELAAWTVRAPLSAEGRLLEELFGDDVPEFDSFSAFRAALRPPALPGRAMVGRALRHPARFRLLPASLALMAPGTRDISDQLASLRQVEGQSWPAEKLWICAVRRGDGRRVVFGRPDQPAAPLHRAIAASCAVPGYFSPVRIGGHTYVDGGAHSPTNAAVLRRQALDLVIVVSPMSGPVGRPTDVYAATRWHSARLARHEVEALRRSGTRVMVFRPDPEVQAAMGNDFMARDHVEEILQSSFLSAGAYAAEPGNRAKLLALAG